MKQNPFINRRPTDNPQEFIGRRALVRAIAQLVGAQTPQSCYVVGERRIGKTSLLRFMTDPKGALAEMDTLLAPGQYIFVYIDLEIFWQGGAKMGQEDIRLPFFRFLFAKMDQAVQKHLNAIHQLELANRLHAHFSHYHDSTALNTLTFIVEGIDEYLCLLLEKPQAIPLTLVLVLDEVDAIIKEGIGYTLRSLMLDRRLAYLLAAERPLEKLDPSGVLSPLYNICTPLRLGLLDENEAEKLVIELAQQAGATSFPSNQADLDYILHIGGRHPDFIKVAAKHIFEARENLQSCTAPEAWYAAICFDLEAVCHTLWCSLAESTDEPSLQPLIIRLVEDHPLDRYEEFLLRLVIERGFVSMTDNDKPSLFSPVFKDYVCKQTMLRQKNAAVPEPGISAPSAPVGPDLHFGDSYFIFNDTYVSVTKQEIALLHYLYTHSGRICSRQQLYTQIWHDGAYAENKAGVINIAMQRLRNKLRQHLHEQLMIETVRNEGYRLILLDPTQK